ncbi:Carboxylesterase 5A [Halocaridina rubra]|uniref:Carboxylic ester hydrolase n=1 Tax=Halocaridina rubra TaxID=373956 RepID=A0AAN9AH44_HALRR
MAMSLFQTVIGVLVAIAAVLFMSTVFPKEVIHEDTGSMAKDSNEKDAIEIQTKDGKVRGFKEFTVNGERAIYAFRGIPFAEPPINEFRFKDPKVVRPWSGVRGGEEPPPCPQFNLMADTSGPSQMIGQEDCLYLNVYTPNPQASDLPVMFWIHGGGFIAGGASTFGGTHPLLLNKDVVLVSIQYRLGILGFLSTEDAVLPGNLGMKDQTLALHWVQKNIREFGGDPMRVTIFGESAGGASVHLHVLSPYSKGLFHQAILQSGNALAPFAIRSDHKLIASEVHKMLNCSNGKMQEDSTVFLECLQRAPVEEVAYTAVRLLKWSFFPLYMVPRVDGDYIPQHPVLLLQNGLFNKVNMMSGFTSHEGAMLAYMMLVMDELKKKIIDEFDLHGPVFCGVENEEAAIFLAKSIFYHHMKNIEASEQVAEEIAEISGEGYFRRGHDDSVILHAKDASLSDTKVYVFEFAHPPERSMGDMFNVSFGKHWVPHAAELRYLFGGIGEAGTDFSSPKEAFVSEIMVDLWTNFARTGNPTPDLSLGFKWHPMTEDSYQRLLIQPSPVMRQDDLAERREFWQSLPITINKLLFPEKFVREGL